MAQPYLGQITMFAGNYAPQNYAFCNGQTLSIQQNTALFSLLGTYYGGNGINTFQLPNLQSSLPLGYGNGAGLSPYVIGQVGGSQNVTVLPNQIPPHTHQMMASTGNASSPSIQNTTVPAKPTATGALFYTNAGTPAPTPYIMTPGALAPAGQSQPHNNLMPSLCITFVIAMSGIFPSRN